MTQSTLSADIVSFTSLETSDRKRLIGEIERLFSKLECQYAAEQLYARIVSGDKVECAMNHPKAMLRIGLMLKTKVKSFELKAAPLDKKRVRAFKEHGVRIAIAVADLIENDKKSGIIDGQAIYLSGRKTVCCF